MHYRAIWFVVEQEAEQGWSLVAKIEATSATQAVAHAAKDEGTYRVRGTNGTEPRCFWVPAWGMPQLRKKGGRSLANPRATR
jgi:hypothetical protein